MALAELVEKYADGDFPCELGRFVPLRLTEAEVEAGDGAGWHGLRRGRVNQRNG